MGFTKGPWEMLANSWAVTTVYAQNKQEIICQSSIYEEATEENQDELVAIQAENMKLIVAAGTAATAVEEMGYDGIEAIRALPELLNALSKIRKSDCGGWLKDCRTGLFSCSEGIEYRSDLMKCLDKAYKALSKAKGESEDIL